MKIAREGTKHIKSPATALDRDTLEGNLKYFHGSDVKSSKIAKSNISQWENSIY